MTIAEATPSCVRTASDRPRTTPTQPRTNGSLVLPDNSISQPFLPILPAVTALLDAAERGVEVQNTVGIHPDRPGPKAPDNPMRPPDVIGLDSSRQSIDGAIRLSDGVVLGVE